MAGSAVPCPTAINSIWHIRFVASGLCATATTENAVYSCCTCDEAGTPAISGRDCGSSRRGLASMSHPFLHRSFGFDELILKYKSNEFVFIVHCPHLKLWSSLHFRSSSSLAPNSSLFHNRDDCLSPSGGFIVCKTRLLRTLIALLLSVVVTITKLNSCRKAATLHLLDCMLSSVHEETIEK